MDQQQAVLDMLEDLTGTDLSNQLDANLFDDGLLDSMATVELVLELQERFEIEVPISEFDRTQWDTANKIIAKVASLA